MSNLVVGISDQKVGYPPDTLTTYALGSCVCICLYDNLRRIGGLAHILLPEAFGDVSGQNVYKFADTAIEALVRGMIKQGCAHLHLTAKIAGGANMFITDGKSIGDRNVETVLQELRRLRIKIVAQDTGANYGRTAVFNTEDGSLTVKTLGRGNKLL
ncbi:MAG TPA: chemotaxis protein CheD [Syntrophomonas sp.]|nr:chemotaxis protein CheD [Syntrophomonas sp.]